jgi:hypothetical protein
LACDVNRSARYSSNAVRVKDEPHYLGLFGHRYQPMRLLYLALRRVGHPVSVGVAAIVAVLIQLGPGNGGHALRVEVGLKLRGQTEVPEEEAA